MTEKIVEHFPGQPLPRDRKGKPINGYIEYDIPDADPDCEEDELDRPSTEAEIALREGIEAYQGSIPKKLPSEVMNVLHDMAVAEGALRRKGARPERIAAQRKKFTAPLGGLLLKHGLGYDDVFQGEDPASDQMTAKVVDLAAARKAALQKEYDDRLDAEADKLGSYDQARAVLADKGVHNPSEMRTN